MPFQLDSDNQKLTQKMVSGQIEDALNNWTKQLTQQAKTFRAQAEDISVWDEAIRRHNILINNMLKSNIKVKVCQHGINSDLDFIEKELEDLEKIVTTMEKDINSSQLVKMEESPRKLYETAEEHETTLRKISEDLKEIIETINERTYPQTPLMQLCRILNLNVNPLIWIEKSIVKSKETVKQLMDQSETENSIVPSKSLNF